MVHRMTQTVRQDSVWYAANFQRLEESTDVDTALARLRHKAFSRFNELGLPTRKHEDWKYTNVAALLRRGPFTLASAAPTPEVTAGQLEPFLPSGSSCARLVFVNGTFSARLSNTDELPDGLTATALAGLLAAGKNGAAGTGALQSHLANYASFGERVFVALNTAFLCDGALLEIAPDTALETPVHIVFVNTGEKTEDDLAIHPRVLILAERGSRATVVESHIGLDDRRRLANPVTEVVVSENARLDHYKIQLEGPGTCHIASIDIEQARHSDYRSFSFSFGGGLVRNDINPVLDGEGAECTLNGLFLIGGSQHADTHTVIDHAKPHCNSHELYKGILGGKSSGVFSGKIIVRQDAQKTNAIQSNNNLLLSRDAIVNSKPQLEIFADDVRCTHGATVGQLDQSALFYMRSRGIDRTAARRMLVHAFATELLDSIENEDVGSFIADLLRTNLEVKMKA